MLSRQLDSEAKFVQASTSPTLTIIRIKFHVNNAPPKSDIEVERASDSGIPTQLNKTLNIALVCGKLGPNIELNVVMKKSTNWQSWAERLELLADKIYMRGIFLLVIHSFILHSFIYLQVLTYLIACLLTLTYLLRCCPIYFFFTASILSADVFIIFR